MCLQCGELKLRKSRPPQPAMTITRALGVYFFLLAFVLEKSLTAGVNPYVQSGSMTVALRRATS